ncbi:MAG: ComEC family competence protein [Candidatus Doudnabacteria bacterium]|nr:ComEC family competence protein [Candidatus Doudnabacteria bacterium]
MPIDWSATIISLGLMIFIMLVTIFWRKRWFMLIGFLGITMLLGAVRYQTSFPHQKENFIGRLYDQKVELAGLITEDPDVRADRTNLVFQPDGYTGEVLLTVNLYPEYAYGDRVKVSGKLKEPFENEEFSYKNYLSARGVYGTISYAQVEKLASGEGHPVKAGLLWVKHKFVDTLSLILPSPHNSLAFGLILGLKRALPEPLLDALIAAGVSHIVVASGYNISIITDNILRTRAYVGRRAAIAFSLLLILAFVVLTGAGASVIRAAVMGLLLLVSLVAGRIYNVVNALVFAGAAMILQNPKILPYDIGFQLSFLATLGLVLLSPTFARWFAKLPNWLNFRTNLAATLAAQIFTLPLLIYYFDRVSLVAPLVNVLILWTVPYAMFFAFVAGLVGFVFLPLAEFAAAATWLILELQIRVVKLFAALPGAAASFKISMLIVVLYYLLLAWTLLYRKKFGKLSPL